MLQVLLRCLWWVVVVVMVVVAAGAVPASLACCSMSPQLPAAPGPALTALSPCMPTAKRENHYQQSPWNDLASNRGNVTNEAQLTHAARDECQHGPGLCCCCKPLLPKPTHLALVCFMRELNIVAIDWVDWHGELQLLSPYCSC